jgi:hypothetical protein
MTQAQKASARNQSASLRRACRIAFCLLPFAFSLLPLFFPMPTKKELLSTPVRHIRIPDHNVVDLVDAMKYLAYSSRDLNRAAEIYARMLQDRDCGVILCLAESLISTGLKQVFVDMVRSNMVDATWFTVKRPWRCR